MTMFIPSQNPLASSNLVNNEVKTDFDLELDGVGLMTSSFEPDIVCAVSVMSL